MASITTVDVGAVLQEIFDDLGEDLDISGLTLTADTKLTDLGMESISLVYLVSELQQHYGLGDRLFRRLRETGAMIRDLSVGDVQTLVVTLRQEMAA
jgi:acyl carrier protein